MTHAIQIKVKEAIGFQSPPDAPECRKERLNLVTQKWSICDLPQHPEHIAHQYKEN